jgi:hypothetical protein
MNQRRRVPLHVDSTPCSMQPTQFGEMSNIRDDKSFTFIRN